MSARVVERTKDKIRSLVKNDLIELNIENIKIDTHQPRKIIEGLDDLAQSIKENGLIQPIIVKKKHDGEYILISGERRYKACIQAGYKKIPCIMKTGYNSFQIKAVQLVENVQRKAMRYTEQAEAIDELLRSEPEMTQIQMAEKIGQAPSWVSRMNKINTAPDNLKTMDKLGYISSTKSYIELIETQKTYPAKFDKIVGSIVDLHQNKDELTTVEKEREIYAQAKKLSQLHSHYLNSGTAKKTKKTEKTKFAEKIVIKKDKVLVYVLDRKHPIEYQINQYSDIIDER